ncbi:MAG TPA: nucleotide exchange factor GrpE [Acidobacteriota bacterium]|nr:nucleotide exchange factor GrpE [Acidobacteriota bacterium]
MSKKAEKRVAEIEGENSQVEQDQEQELHDPGIGPSESDQEVSEELRRQWEDRIGELKRERSEYQDLLQRKQAEFENYRKRTLREREGIRLAAQSEVLRSLLSVADACQAGIESMPQDEDEPRLQSYRDGYELLAKEIDKVFSNFGVEEVPGQGEPFNPNLHEAVMREESEEHPDGIILEEFRKGYRIGDYLLRPSQVKVSVRPQSEEEGQSVEVDIKA